MFFVGLHGVLASSKNFLGSGPPPAVIFVDSTDITEDGTELVATYTTSGAAEKNQLPVASGVLLEGFKNVGETVTVAWEYFHINNSAAGSSIIQIQTADNSGFSLNLQTVSTSTTYVLASGDVNKYLRVRITPVTIDGTQGVAVDSPTYQVGNGLIQKQIKISLGHAAKAFAAAGWNFAHTDNPDGSYALTTISNSDGEVLSGVTLDVDLAMSDSTVGSSNAGTGAASEFPAGAAAGFWYPASGTRGFVITVPGGGLGVGFGEISILSNTTSGTTNQGIHTVNNETKTLSNVTGSTVDDVNIFTNVDMTGNITIRGVDGTGLSPMNALIINYYVVS